MQSKKYALNFTWNDFLDWLDANGDYNIVNEYVQWLVRQLEVQYNLVPQNEEKEETDKKKLNIKE